jgi:hypothetical protein
MWIPLQRASQPTRGSFFGWALMLLLLVLPFLGNLLLRVWAFEWLYSAFHTGEWWRFVLAALCWNVADLTPERK